MEYMVTIYVMLVRAGARTIDSLPKEYQDRVKEEIEKVGA